ncbi:hypothetical protein HC752_23685 [Vibrio sp. S9_S30]|uniref:hypothetical protein n=1 Tax=Vibrio sp. S9_S30 TaxID=2720226 RepID=UPI0016804A20|nr:hypothetical protein [Vibrio sp. S9_S30]MBD1559930.1 hypothetical protein [Vibrio sp. S9_S30]
MANIVQRNFQRSLAASVTAVAEELGLPQAEVVEVMNEEFGYVDNENPNEVATLIKQVELDTAAEKHARENSVTVSKRAVVLTALERDVGTLSRLFDGKDPQPT